MYVAILGFHPPCPSCICLRMATSRLTLTRSPTVKVKGTVVGARLLDDDDELLEEEEEEALFGWEGGSGARISIGSPVFIV